MRQDQPSWRSECPLWRGGQHDPATGLTYWRVEQRPLSLDVGPADWRAYRTLKLWVSCPEATGAQVRLEMLGCEEEPIGYVIFAADWQGERELSFPLAAFEPYGDEERWHLVHALRLSCEHPGISPTTLILGAVEAHASPLPSKTSPA